MKKGISRRFFSLLGSTLLTMGVLAQEKDSVKMLPPVTITPASNVEQSVTKAFHDNFKNATNAKWYDIDKNYLVKFISDDMQNNVLFKKNGSMVYHISYGYEKNLEADVKEMVKYSYPNYEITRAIKVRMENRDVWVLNLEGTKRLILVAVEEGQLSEIKNFAKS
jgi:hypothetical protein